MSQAAQQKPKTAITPTRAEDYPEWYQQVIRAADMAEPSSVRGCMVIKPWGYALWENMQRTLDDMFKSTGVVNAYFPLFIPLSYLEKEAEHVEGFAKECAIVTHHRLVPKPDGSGLMPDPEAKLDEPLIVRPTSETIIGASFAKWVQSYRDLPLLVNQWCNVVRWEMRTRLFLRTAEFLWQEGHTVHATREEAVQRTTQMLNVYADFAENHLAIPVIRGRKSAGERFPGAVDTLTIEAMMQDRRALQSATSHFLGQNFSIASGIQFQTEGGDLEHAWTTSWGLSTRTIGALIMAHADDDGVIMPPRVAPALIVLIPVLHSAKNEEAVRNYCQKLADDLRTTRYHGTPISVEVDTRDMRGGDKIWSWIKKGVPIRLEVGERDMEKDSVFVGRRDRSPKEKEAIARERFLADVVSMLDEIQHTIFERARAFREQNTQRIDSKQDFYDFFAAEDAGGFALAHWSGDPAIEQQVQTELRVTLRCIPLHDEEGPGICPFTGKPSAQRVVWAKAY